MMNMIFVEFKLILNIEFYVNAFEFVNYMITLLNIELVMSLIWYFIDKLKGENNYL